MKKMPVNVTDIAYSSAINLDHFSDLNDAKEHRSFEWFLIHGF